MEGSVSFALRLARSIDVTLSTDQKSHQVVIVSFLDMAVEFSVHIQYVEYA